MINNKKGFTLAEVLVTLGIIGVIASLTTPALVKNARNEANASRLSVAISNVENALTNAVAQEGVDSLAKTSIWTKARNGNNIDGQVLYGNFARYMYMSGYSAGASAANIKAYYNDEKAPYKMTSSGAKNTAEGSRSTALDSCHIMETKSGAVIFINPISGSGQGFTIKEEGKDPVTGLPKITQEYITPEYIVAQGGSLAFAAGTIYIDVNGKSAPNIIGRDIFGFILGQNGILYPYGSRDVSLYMFKQANDRWDNASATNYGCLDNNISGDGLGCTARLIAEGYKMNY